MATRRCKLLVGRPARHRRGGNSAQNDLADANRDRPTLVDGSVAALLPSLPDGAVQVVSQVCK